jgi:hypothetical protein
MKNSIALLIILASLIFINKAQAQTAEKEAIEAIRDAQLSADIASLSGTAEGLYRGCKVDHDVRNRKDNTDPELTLSLELMEQCINFIEGAAAVTFWEVKILRGCSNKMPLSRNQIIDGIVALVKKDPLLIGAGKKREWLLRAALLDLSGCNDG